MILAGITIISFTYGYAQKGYEPVSAKEKAKLRAAVEAKPNDLEVHKAYLKTFASADEAKAQYEQWMKKYPKSATIPQALGEKYGTYSPISATYLLKAAELDPKNVSLWQKLALAASLSGDNTKQQEYFLKAASADPRNLNLQYEYFRLFIEHDKAFWKKKTWELTEKHPTDPATWTALHLMGYFTSDLKERIAIWERQRSMVPKDKITSAGTAMGRLGSAYIQAGQYDKAIELSQTMLDAKAQERSFAPSLQLAKVLAEIDKNMKEGKQVEARELLNSLHPSRIDKGSRVILVKASVLDATGDTKAAYDSLIIFQARTPYMDVKDALEKYGQKLGKSQDQVKKDVRGEIAKNSKPATPFELDMYTSDKKMKLSDHKGKVMFLSFWFPGCGPCRGEMPHIEAAIKGIDKSKFSYLGVNGLREQDGFVLPFLKGTRYSFTPLGADENVTKDYGVRGYPSNFIIDQEGRIAYSGFLIHADNEEAVKLMIDSLL
ncbi:MAG TPA: redoxin domain-containing protein [Chitinophagaceae bacterium]|nr:redoxin domain-containing protein [Chitinophagaceae bacterium]